MQFRLRSTGLAAVILVGLLWSAAAADGLSDAEFRSARSAATKLMKRPGEIVEKRGVVATLARDDSARALEVLVRWARASASLRKQKLEPAAEKRRAAYDSYRAKVLKKHGGSEDGWSDGQNSKAAKRHEAWSEANALVVTEVNLQGDIASAVRRAKSEGAIRFLGQEGMAQLLSAEGLEPIVEAVVGQLLTHAPSLAGEAVLSAITRDLTPQVRIRALEWIAAEALENATVRIAPCLRARSVPVRRATVRALTTLDNPLAVPPLIEALDDATGLLAAEMEDLLHRFTGHSFNASGAAWQRWFKEQGPSWLAREHKKRHARTAAGGDVDFYGIPSPSDRIVFVLDRSGSMATPAAEKPAGVVTSDGKKAAAVEQTKLQVAKTELRRAINRLGVDVKFNVLFYNHKVDCWRAPPALVDATRKNKASARTWLMSQKPVGSTELFAALMRALGHGDDLSKAPKSGTSGVDTIFLLSDGDPTTGIPARLLTQEEIDEAVEKFLRANRHQRCVVHTIGVGPLHNKELMKRLAAETGGIYVAVGMDD